MKFYKAVHQVIGDAFVYDCYINPGRGPIEFRQIMTYSGRLFFFPML